MLLPIDAFLFLIQPLAEMGAHRQARTCEIISARPPRLPRPDKSACSSASPWSRLQWPRSSKRQSVGAPPRHSWRRTRAREAHGHRRRPRIQFPGVEHGGTSARLCVSSGSEREKPSTKFQAMRPWSRVFAAMTISRRGWWSISPSNAPRPRPAESAVLALPRPIDSAATLTLLARAPLTNRR